MATNQPDDADRPATESGRTFLMRTAYFVAGRAVAATARQKQVVAAKITSLPFQDGLAATSAGAGILPGAGASVEFAEPIHVAPMALMDAYPFVVYAGPWAQSRVQMEGCKSRGHQDCRRDAAADDRGVLDAQDDEHCRALALDDLLDESQEWSALVTGLPPGDAAENSLHEDLMPLWDQELDRLWPRRRSGRGPAGGQRGSGRGHRAPARLALARHPTVGPPPGIEPSPRSGDAVVPRGPVGYRPCRCGPSMAGRHQSGNGGRTLA